MDAVNLPDFNTARKDTVAVLDGVAVTMPEAYTIRPTGEVNSLGIPKPVSPPTAAVGAAGVLDGAYIYKVTYKDSAKGYFGEGSDTFSVTATLDTVNIDLTPLTNEADHSEVDYIQIWRSQAGGTILFFVAEVATGTASYADNSSDATISVNDTLPVAEQAYKFLSADTFGNVLRTKDRLMYMTSRNYYENHENRNRICWTPIEPNTGTPFVEAVPDENYITLENGGEHIRAASMMGDILVIMEDAETWVGVWIDDPDPQVGNGTYEPMKTGRGAVTWKSLIDADGDLWAMDRLGFWNYRGGQSVTDVTEAVQADFDRINWNERAQFCGASDDKRIVWFVALDADTECRHAFVLDRKSLQSGKGTRWWVYKLPFGVRDCCQDRLADSSVNEDYGMSGRRVIRIMTTSGHEGLFSEHIYIDGVHPEMTQAGVTAGAATTTFTCTGATFVVGSATLEGVYVLFDHPTTPTPLRILSSTSDTFTLHAAIGSLPAGTGFKLGRIQGKWTSGQLDAGGPEAMKTYATVGVVVNPMPQEGEIRVVTRTDRRGEFVAGKTETARTGTGLTIYTPGAALKTGGKLRGTGNRVGYQEVPVHNRDGHYIEVEFQDDSILPWELVGYYVNSTPYVKKKK